MAVQNTYIRRLFEDVRVESSAAVDFMRNAASSQENRG